MLGKSLSYLIGIQPQGYILIGATCEAEDLVHVQSLQPAVRTMSMMVLSPLAVSPSASTF